ncbi:MAG: flagellar biosynthetic protein FliR [Treponema sp.]|nr:flagellar biosynthetic protein FliR [Treponema sp.]
MLDRLLAQAPFFLLAAVRCFALLMTLPLFSMRNVPSAARVALAIFLAYNILGQVDYSAYSAFLSPEQTFTAQFLALLVGEALIGVIIGFYVSIIFSAFSAAGQFFAFQMGFSASEVYDALSQVENPLMGQYLNLIAMLVFMQTGFFQKLFLGGLVSSFKTISAYSIVSDMAGGAVLPRFFLRSLSELFANALVISLPVIGTLMLITISVGMLSKAAPQMNLLSEGFPIMLLTSFFILTALMPSIINAFSRCFDGGFARLEQLLLALGGKKI